MAKPEKYIEDVTMDNADNGVIIRYSERKKRNDSTYDDYSYCRREEVFQMEEDEEGEFLDKAMERFKELFKQAREYKMKK